MEEMLKGENLEKALSRVESNKGAAGIDGMKVDELRPYFKREWRRIKAGLLSGTYQPSPVRRVEIPKANGGKRMLGIPTVVDRFVQQAVIQVLSDKWDKTFSEYSYGFRPKRSTHQAVARAQEYIKSGKRWVVDIDLEKFFDRVNHDVLMSLIAKRTQDKMLLKLIRSFLRAGIMTDGLYSVPRNGTPQGGPLAPLLSNIMLDVLDRELVSRGHKFVRYADDCNIYVSSKKAAERVMAGVTKFLGKKLKLKVNVKKSSIEKPWNLKFLGFTFGYYRGIRRMVSPISVKRFKRRVRGISRRIRGISIDKVISEMNRYLRGWMCYYGFAQAKSIFKELDRWIRHRIRAMIWKQWGRRGYRELRKLGVSVRLAWNTAKSAHGPWRLSNSPARTIALPIAYFDKLGLIQLMNFTD
ncbi:MAG: group II intron reverse transcriptase/maturase [Candidatus Omnitrophica bacterium]|nr:group II intron reverse transcriptase/maturase [Candidatus Omnitrophota bacterium]